MATIANLAVLISADGRGVEKTFNDVGKKIKSTEKGAMSMENVFKGLKTSALILGAVVASVVAMGVSLAKGVIDDLKISRKLGDDIGALEEFRYALTSIGGPSEKAGEILQKLNKTLADASSGIDPGTADALSRIGLSAQKLAGMKPSDAMKEIAEAISKIPDASKRAAVATQIFGDSAADLLPILTRGRVAFDESAASIDKLGGGIDNLKAAELERIAIQADKFQQQLKIAAVTVLSELVPFLKMMGEYISSAIGEGVKFTDVIKTIGLTIGLFILLTIELFRTIKLVVQFIKLGIIGIAKAILWAVTQVLNIAAKLPEDLGGGKFKDAANAVKGWGDAVGEEMDSTVTDIDDNIAKIGTSINKFPEMLKKSVLTPVARAGDAMADAMGGKGAVAAADKFANLFAKGKDITNELRTPFEKFGDKMTELNALLDKGAISWETYAKASAEAVSQLEKAHELQSMSMPKAVMKDTVEAASVINQQQMRDARYREKPEERVARVLEQSLEIEKKQLEQTKKVANAVQNQKIVKF